MEICNPSSKSLKYCRLIFFSFGKKDFYYQECSIWESSDKMRTTTRCSCLYKMLCLFRMSQTFDFLWKTRIISWKINDLQIRKLFVLIIWICYDEISNSESKVNQQILGTCCFDKINYLIDFGKWTLFFFYYKLVVCILGRLKIRKCNAYF